MLHSNYSIMTINLQNFKIFTSFDFKLCRFEKVLCNANNNETDTINIRNNKSPLRSLPKTLLQMILLVL